MADKQVYTALHPGVASRPRMQGRPAAQKPKKGRVWPKIVFALATLAVYAASGLGAFALLGGFTRDAAPPGFRKTGQVAALRVAAPADVSDEVALSGYFAAAADFAAQNGFDTLVFEAKPEDTVWWRDDVFPPAEGIGGQDSLFYRMDPLALLCQVLSGREIQLWLEVNCFGAPGDTSRALDDAYRARLTESLAALPLYYSIAGLVLTGVENAVSAQALSSQANAPSLADFMADLDEAIRANGREAALCLAFDATQDAVVTPERLADIQKAGHLAYALPRAQGQNAAAQFAAYAPSGAALLAVQPGGAALAAPDYESGAFLFGAHRQAGFAGTLLAAWPEDQNAAAQIALLRGTATPADGAPFAGFSLPQQLAVTWPSQNAVIDNQTSATGQLWVTGTSNPAQPLTLDGREVPRGNDTGLFGVAVTLETGENNFTFAQGDSSFTLTVTRPGPGGGGGGGGGGIPWGSTPQAQKGQAVRVAALITGVLKDPDNDYAPSLNETLPRGAVFVAEGSVRTTRWNAETGRTEYVWAYQMESGEYVLGSHCELIDGDGQADFTGVTVTADAGGEWLDFTGTGSPAAYVAYGNDTGELTLTFYDTALSLPEGFSSGLVTAANAQTADGVTTLRLATQNLWGYSLEYSEAGTRLYLKSAPVRGEDPARPLQGVTVLLDPGHGGTDVGALGVMGSTGPNEKDLNLALAQTIAYRLRQLGAEVTLTRTGDDTLSLQDRLEAQTLRKPDFFLSVHHNSVALDQDRSEVHGVESYYYHPYNTPPSQGFAQALMDRVAADTARTARRGGEASWYEFYVTRTTACPSVLFEFGFLPNPDEFADVASEAGMAAAAFAVGWAMADCF